MKRRLERLLRRWPLVHRIAARAYGNLNFQSMAERIVGTRAWERSWATRHLRKGNDWNNVSHVGDHDEWIMSYWDSRSHPHRQFLVEKVAAFSPLSSILEIGCNCGPNLYLLARRFPNADIVGIDINQGAIERGNELLADAGIGNVKLSVGKADGLRRFADKSFDVVFTDAVLIYIGHDRIDQTVRDMMRVSRKGLVLLERQIVDDREDKLGLGVRFGGCWERDYVALLSKFVPANQIRVSRITEDVWPDARWKAAGALIEASF